MRAAAQERAEILTPITKGWGTDLGVEMTSLAVQVHGGMGYIEETGVAQHYRDARIAPIYEGTNGIQAMDLVGRKLGLRGGAAIRRRSSTPSATTADEAGAAGGELAVHRRRPRTTASPRCATATAWLLANAPGRPQQRLRRGHAVPPAGRDRRPGRGCSPAAALAAAALRAGDGDGFSTSSSTRSWSRPASSPPRSCPQVAGLLPAVTAGPPTSSRRVLTACRRRPVAIGPDSGQDDDSS